MELVELHEVEETFSVNEICKRIKNLEEAVEKLKENNQRSEFKESANQDFKTIPVEEMTPKVERIEKNEERIGKNKETVKPKENPNEDQDLPKEKVIKEKANKFINGLTIHGLQRLIKADNILVKLVWTVCILTSVGFGLYIIIKTISDYNKFEVITNARMVYPKSVTFPAITVCSQGTYQKNIYENNSLIKTENITENILKKFIDFNNSIFKNTALSSYQLEFFQITEFFSYCVRFNGNDTQNIDTTDDVLDLTINTNYFEKISEFTSEEYIYTPSVEYYTVYVIDNFYDSYLSFEPLYIKLNHDTALSLQKTIIEKRLDEPYNLCLKNDKTYRQDNCKEMCIIGIFKTKYNCSLQSYYQTNHINLCNLNPEEIDNEYKNCEQDCIEECDSVKYIAIPTDSFYLESNRTRFYFIVTDFSSLEISQIPKMSVFNLISSIGGALGLFIGIRFMSLVEVIELFIDILITISPKTIIFPKIN